MTIFVESNVFKQMLSYKPYVTDKHGKKQVKYSLLDRIKEGLGDKWNRLKEGTRQTFDQICFFSAELGFFYASDKYLAEYNNVSLRTIQYRLNELIKLGEVIKVNRRAKRSNGKGKAVYLFVNHPYFTYWTELLGITNCNTDCATEKAKIPTESKNEGPGKISTYSLPKKQESTIYKASNEFVPSEIQNDTDFQNIVGMYSLQLYDKVKKGFNIKSFSSLVSKDISHKIRLALYDANARDNKRRKQREAKNDHLAIELGIKKQKGLPFYNWLEN